MRIRARVAKRALQESRYPLLWRDALVEPPQPRERDLVLPRLWPLPAGDELPHRPPRAVVDLCQLASAIDAEHQEVVGLTADCDSTPLGRLNLHEPSVRGLAVVGLAARCKQADTIAFGGEHLADAPDEVAVRREVPAGVHRLESARELVQLIYDTRQLL